MILIEYKQLNPLANIPTQGTPGSAGYDLYSVETMEIPAGQVGIVPLGFSAAMDPSMYVQIFSRSSLAVRGITVLAGVIDSDYRGEWKVILLNTTREPFLVVFGDRVAQAVPYATTKLFWQPVDSLSDTVRGAGGYGSTGR